MPHPAILRVGSYLPLPVSDARAFLESLDHAYTNLRFLEALVDDAFETQETRVRVFPLGYYYRESEDIDPALFISPSDRLVLTSAHFNSPGFWDFLGSLNPLQQIREYLNDRHERRKDREYREDLERRKMELENERLRTEVLDKQIEVLAKAGYSKPYIRRLLNKHYHAPLERLGPAADNAGVTEVAVEHSPTRGRNA